MTKISKNTGLYLKQLKLTQIVKGQLFTDLCKDPIRSQLSYFSKCSKRHWVILKRKGLFLLCFLGFYKQGQFWMDDKLMINSTFMQCMVPYWINKILHWSMDSFVVGFLCTAPFVRACLQKISLLWCIGMCIFLIKVVTGIRLISDLLD